MKVCQKCGLLIWENKEGYEHECNEGTERLESIKEKVDFVEYWEGYYLSSSDVQWLIKEAETCDELDILYNSVVSHRDQLLEEVERYKKAIKAFEDEFAYECHWQIQNAQGQSRWHKGALEGFNHVKRIFNKYFK